MAKSNKRPLVAFKAPRRLADFIIKVRAIILGIKNNPLIFVTPVPVPATVTNDTDALEAAEAVAKTRLTGAASARDIKYAAVLNDVRGWMGYVQNLLTSVQMWLPQATSF